MKTLGETLIDGENQFQAFFENTQDSLEIAKTAIAFSNTYEGKIIIGIKKNGKIIGVNPQAEIQNFINITKEFCEFQSEYIFNIIQDSFRMVLEVVVPVINKKPNYLLHNGQREVYVRSNKFNVKSNKILENSWKFISKNNPRPLTLSDIESEVLNFIKLNAKSSLNKIHKNMNHPIATVDFILVRLISWELIGMEILETYSEFSIIDTP